MTDLGYLIYSKKFVLFPPWEWENLYMYPRIHPSWHKSQLSFDSVPLDTYPNARNITAYEVPPIDDSLW